MWSRFSYDHAGADPGGRRRSAQSATDQEIAGQDERAECVLDTRAAEQDELVEHGILPSAGFFLATAGHTVFSFCGLKTSAGLPGAGPYILKARLVLQQP